MDIGSNSPAPSGGRERRRHDRFPCKLKVTYLALADLEATPIVRDVTHSKDLSESGMRLFTEHKIELPALVQVSVSIPIRPCQMLLLAHALWCRPAEDERGLYEVGLRFVGIMPPDFQQLINEYGSTLLSGH